MSEDTLATDTWRKNHTECTGFIRKSLQDPRVVFILNQIHNMGCKMPTPFFRCIPCLSSPDEVPTMTAGYILGSFDNYDDFVSTTTEMYKEDAAPDISDALDAVPTEEKPGEYKYQKMIDKPGVVVCQDVMALYPSPSEYTNQVLHELVHAFDDCRAKINWHNCDQIACAEIRASALSGECRYKIERARGKAGVFSGVTGQMQACVRRRALLSVKNSRYCQGKDCEAIVDKHFTQCFADVEPFVERP